MRIITTKQLATKVSSLAYRKRLAVSIRELELEITVHLLSTGKQAIVISGYRVLLREDNSLKLEENGPESVDFQQLRLEAEGGNKDGKDIN